MYKAKESIGLLVLFSFILLFVSKVANSQITEDQIIHPVSSERFGTEIDVSANTVVVGSTRDNVGGLQTVGQVYVYEQDLDGNLTLIQTLSASDPAENSLFGLNLAISGDRIVVGVSSAEVNGVALQGKVYIFERNPGGLFEEVDILTASDGLEGDSFGSCVGVSGDTILVGASQSEIGELDRAGNAYIFERDAGGVWQETKLSRVSPVTEFEVFGDDCSLSGDYAIIGAPAWSEQRGYADIYERDAQGDWNHAHRFTRSGGEKFDQVGKDVYIDGDSAILGAEDAYKTGPFGIVGIGAAFILERDETGAWNPTELFGSDNDYSKFGSGVSISENKAIVGASRATSTTPTGKAYTYEKLGNGQWVETGILLSSVPSATFLGSRANIAGNTYLVSSSHLNGSLFVYQPLESSFSLLAFDPSRAGETNTLTAINSTAGGDITFVYGFVPGASDASSICPGLQIDLEQFFLLTTIKADSDGVGSFSIFLGPGLAGLSVYLQAVDVSSCTASNINFETIQDPTPFTLLNLNPPVAGLHTDLTADGATPNSLVTFIWGFLPGSFSDDRICPGLQAGIIDYNLLATVGSDGAGAASFDFVLPLGASGLSVLLQAVDVSSCTASNVNMETIEEYPGDLIFNPIVQIGPNLHTYTINNATPGGEVVVLKGFEPGLQASFVCEHLDVDILDFSVQETFTADPDGNVSGELMIGGSPGGVGILYFQAIDLETCRKSIRNEVPF